MVTSFDNTNIDLIETLKAKLLYDPENIKLLIMLSALRIIKSPECEKALHDLKKVIKLDPGNVEARFWLATCLFYYCKYDLAEKTLVEALALDPHRADCLSLLAYLHWDKKEFDSALLHLRKAIQINPDWPMLRIELISLLIHLGRKSEAEQELEQASQLLNQAIKISANEVEGYYERAITGRSWTDLADRLHRLKKLLN